MTDQRLEEIISESIIAVTAEYAEDLQDARELLADAALYLEANPWADHGTHRARIEKFLERMAEKEMVRDLE